MIELLAVVLPLAVGAAMVLAYRQGVRDGKAEAAAVIEALDENTTATGKSWGGEGTVAQVGPVTFGASWDVEMNSAPPPETPRHLRLVDPDK